MHCKLPKGEKRDMSTASKLQFDIAIGFRVKEEGVVLAFSGPWERLKEGRSGKNM